MEWKIETEVFPSHRVARLVTGEGWPAMGLYQTGGYHIPSTWEPVVISLTAFSLQGVEAMQAHVNDLAAHAPEFLALAAQWDAETPHSLRGRRGVMDEYTEVYSAAHVYALDAAVGGQAARIRQLEAERDALRAAVGDLTPEAVTACVEAVLSWWNDDATAAREKTRAAVDLLPAALLGEPADAPGDGEREV